MRSAFLSCRKFSISTHCSALVYSLTNWHWTAKNSNIRFRKFNVMQVCIATASCVCRGEPGGKTEPDLVSEAETPAYAACLDTSRARRKNWQRFQNYRPLGTRSIFSWSPSPPEAY